MADIDIETIRKNIITPENFPKFCSNARIFPSSPDEEIVICGASGRFPSTDSVDEFSHNLYNKIDMITDKECRWSHSLSQELPRRKGVINNISKFDATFFGVHHKQVNAMDPQGRQLIECAYEAILDSGIHPSALRGSRTGVFVAVCFSETEKSLLFDTIQTGGFSLAGCSRAMMSNRISYCLGLTGPSFTVDTACSSAMFALDCAFTAMRTGQCDSALICGTNLILHPYTTINFFRLGVLSADGYCRPFCQKASGYTRSETICALFLQKSKDAKRIYAKVVYSNVNCDGYKTEGITYPSRIMQEQLLTEFYNDIAIDPRMINYVEAHGTGTVVGDPEECKTLDNVFCKNRKEPLLVGSVKSSIGHTEASAGICSILKVLLAFETGLVSPNINFEEIRKEVPALAEGRLKVCTEATPLPGNLVAVNSFGFGGANAHALLARYEKAKINKGIPEDSTPRLIQWAGRTEEAVNKIFDTIESMPLDAEFIALLQGIQNYEVTGNLYRGYGIYEKGADGGNSTRIARACQHFDATKHPVVWMFTGMGCQWAGMGVSLMQLDIFRESIERCHKVLEPYGLDLISIITSPDTTTFDQIINSFVGIAAIQVALVDILRVLDIPFDYCIGHSVGELGCAYADGSLTAEQMVLAAYARGLVSYETKVTYGSMAAVGLSYSQVKDILPEGIEIACHNSANSATLSGPKDNVTAFVDELKKKNIFAKEVPCSNIPYHSKYIAEMGPKLLAKLEEIIPQPIKRSSKWISSSVPKDRWNTEKNQYSSAEYHTNNLLSPVLFEEASLELPENAITIEIAPHGLLQSIIKKALPKGIHIPLTHRNNKDNTSFFLSAVGKLFLNGITMSLENIYPKITYPVSRGTRMIASLIKWDHSQDWFVAEYDLNKTQITGERKLTISLDQDDFGYMAGHIIDGRCLLPATSYLHIVRETLVYMTPGQNFDGLSIEFENVRFLRATSLNADSTIRLTIVVHIGSGSFEISEGTTSIVNGVVRTVKDPKPITEIAVDSEIDVPTLNTPDFYKELKLRGYNYTNIFKSVTEARSDGVTGKVKWVNRNWAAFMDCLLQINILAIDSRSLYLPTSIRKIRINTAEHLRQAEQLDPENPVFEARMSRELDMIVAGGIEIVGMNVNSVSRRKPAGTEVLEDYRFVPLISELHENYTKENAAKIFLQITTENMLVPKLKIVEMMQEEEEQASILPSFDDALIKMPLIIADLILLTKKKLTDLDHVAIEDAELKAHKDCNYVIAYNRLNDTEFLAEVLANLNGAGYFINRGKLTDDIQPIEGFQLISVLNSDCEKFSLFRRLPSEASDKLTVVKIKSDEMTFEWLDPLREAIRAGPALIVSQKDQQCGVMGLVNCIRREPGGNKLKCIQIDDKTAPTFSLDEPIYREQMKLNLAFNVYRDGVWGTYRHLNLEADDIEQPRERHYYVNMKRLGDLSSFVWMSGSLDASKLDNYVNTQYVSINFRDVMMATGRLPPEIQGVSRSNTQNILGLEYSGIDKNGERVMGMVGLGALATLVEPIQYLTWKVPKTISLRDAATIPAVYTTIYYAFFLHRPISKGKSILIHAGSGGIGLAAIRVAFAYGLEVYTTVSTEIKKKYILEQYPQLKEENIGNSRDCSFEDMIKLRTKGAGVDFVLNSLAEDKLAASLRCLGQNGTFLEIGKFDIMNNSALAMQIFAKEVTFRAVFADNLLKYPDDRKSVYEMVLKDLQNGIIQPLNSTVFQANDIEKAFRFLSTGKHIGKVMIQVRDTERSKYTLPFKVLERTYCDPDLVYVIAGGLGGFGLELTDWLVTRGAQKLVLSSRKGVVTGYQAYRIKTWESYGTKILISTSDITTPQGCKKLFEEALVEGPIGGIFNLAVVLQDSILDNQTVEKFKESFLPKANATRFLDELSRVLCSQLQHFVVFSSASCGRGNAGQSNYGMANSIMERIIEQRVKDKLPGKAIQWGAIGEVGLVAEMSKDKIDVEIAGTIQQRVAACLTAMDILLNNNEPIVSSMVVAQKRKGGKLNVIDSVLHIMGIRDLKQISQKSSLAELGMDSLMAVEIKQALEREFEINLTAQDLRVLTFAKLQEISNANNDPANRTKLLSAQNQEDDEDRPKLFRSFGDEKTSKQTILKANDLDVDKFDVCALLVPGVEGVAGPALLKIGKNLSIPSFVLQLHKSAEKITVTEIVASVTGEVLSLFKSKKYFYLVGHSFGAVVALELAKLLERMGLKGEIISLDGSVLLIKNFVKSSMRGQDMSDDILQDLILKNFAFSLLPDVQQDVLRTVMKDAKTWDEKLNNFVGVVRNEEYSHEYLKTIGTGMFNRFMFVLKSDTDAEITSKIQSNIRLYKPTIALVAGVQDDYQLPKYTNGKVEIEHLEGDHLSILENLQLIDVLNGIFESKN